jgi:hypothetical protein
LGGRAVARGNGAAAAPWRSSRTVHELQNLGGGTKRAPGSACKVASMSQGRGNMCRKLCRAAEAVSGAAVWEAPGGANVPRAHVVGACVMPTCPHGRWLMWASDRAGAPAPCHLRTREPPSDRTEWRGNLVGYVGSSCARSRAGVARARIANTELSINVSNVQTEMGSTPTPLTVRAKRVATARPRRSCLLRTASRRPKPANRAGNRTGALAASYFASSRARRASPAPRTTRGTARAARPPADSSRTIHAPTVANISTATIHGHEHESRRCANHPQRRACSVSHLGSCKVCVF